MLKVTTRTQIILLMSMTIMVLMMAATVVVVVVVLLVVEQVSLDSETINILYFLVRRSIS